MTSSPLPPARPDAPAGRPPAAGPGNGLLLAGVLLTALNLRGAITAVSPVLPDIRADLGLSPTVAGLLTTLPVLCFAALAPGAAWLGRRIGARAAVLAGLLAIAAGTGLRVLGGPPVLLAATFVIGAGMTVGNVLLPPITKSSFGARAGTVTGLYTGALVVGAATMAGLTAPLASLTGWRVALALWGILALVAAAVWVVATRTTPGGEPLGGSGPAPGSTPAPVWRSPVAWAVAAVLSLQSALFYAVTAWLPTLLVDEVDASLPATTLAATLFQVCGIVGTLVVPAVVGLRPGQSWLGIAVALTWIVLLVGLLVAPGAWPVWATVGGVAQGAGISLAMTLVVLRAREPETVRRLSGMSQLVGYAVGACGPLAVGAVYSASGGWAVPLWVLLGVAAAMAVATVLAGRPRSLDVPS